MSSVIINGVRGWRGCPDLEKPFVEHLTDGDVPLMGTVGTSKHFGLLASIGSLGSQKRTTRRLTREVHGGEHGD